MLNCSPYRYDIVLRTASSTSYLLYEHFDFIYMNVFFGFVHRARSMRRYSILSLALILISISSYGQVDNDVCFTATVIEDLQDFCSVGYTSVGSTVSDEVDPSCWPENNSGRDVWYLFTPREEGILLRFFGADNNNDYTLENFSVTIYEGRCNDLSELQCRPDNPNNEFERLFNNLAIGRPHYIRVSHADNNPGGTFELCLRQFVPIPEPQQDCNTGVVLCDKSVFVVEKLENGGLDNREGENTCLWEPTDNQPSETGSVWYKWTALTTGTLTFTLTPNSNDPREDLDFAVFRFPGGLGDCLNKEVVLCMASGETQGLGNGNLPCLGPTGLREGDTDVVEFRGCDPGDNNFLAPLNMIEGESYGLLVNNFSESGFGFSIEFGGTGEFLGPEPDFAFTAVDDFECDKTITFENLSMSNTDDIVSLRWRFGEGAIPFEAMGEGPHDVIYDSFGPKVAVLTVETARGCRVTKSLDIEVQSCCSDQATLELTPNIIDLSCFESEDGVIMASAQNGTPEYLYSLDGGRLLPTDIFNGLAAGDYTLTVLDMKGCEISEDFTVDQPEEILLTLSGPTDTVRLGSSGQITSDFFPADRELVYMWTPPNGLSCDDCPDPEVIPPGTTVYTLTVTDQDGCMQQMDILILTDNVKPFYAPNIISLSASSDVNNGIFKIFSNISAEVIEDLSIFDRWGGEMYNIKDVGFEEDRFEGWNGVVQNTGRKVNPGVFVWVAKVRFIDGDIRTFTGDLTVVD